MRRLNFFSNACALLLWLVPSFLDAELDDIVCLLRALEIVAPVPELMFEKSAEVVILIHV